MPPSPDFSPKLKISRVWASCRLRIYRTINDYEEAAFMRVRETQSPSPGFET